MNRTIIATLLAPFVCVPAVALGQTPCGPTRYVSPPGVEPTDFGISTATNGRFWFVGDGRAFTPCTGFPTGCLTGAVHVYELIEGALIYRQTLVPSVLGLDMFGVKVAASGDQLVVGTLFTSWPTTAGFGGGFVYEYNGEEWVETARLVPPPEFTGDQFAWGMAFDHGLAIFSPSNTLEQYAYEPGPEGWELTRVPTSPDGRPRSAGYGAQYDIEEDWIFTMAWKDSSRVPEGGSAYVFRREANGELIPWQKIFPPDPERNRRFGTVVSDGRTLAIGAQWADREHEYQGAIFIYELEGEFWQLRQELLLRDPRESDRLIPIAIEGDTLLTRIVRVGREPLQDAMVILFRRGADGLWREVGPLTPNPVEAAFLYGFGSSTDGTHALIGAGHDQFEGALPGAAYLFNLECIGCRPDLDSDGQLTIFDFLTFQNLFAAGDLAADFDGDGELTIFDFLAFQTAFAEGCE